MRIFTTRELLRRSQKLLPDYNNYAIPKPSHPLRAQWAPQELRRHHSQEPIPTYRECIPINPSQEPLYEPYYLNRTISHQPEPYDIHTHAPNEAQIDYIDSK